MAKAREIIRNVWVNPELVEEVAVLTPDTNYRVRIQFSSGKTLTLPTTGPAIETVVRRIFGDNYTGLGFNHKELT